jgi:hypothetical protein
VGLTADLGEALGAAVPVAGYVGAFLHQRDKFFGVNGAAKTPWSRVIRYGTIALGFLIGFSLALTATVEIDRFQVASQNQELLLQYKLGVRQVVSAVGSASQDLHNLAQFCLSGKSP